MTKDVILSEPNTLNAIDPSSAMCELTDFSHHETARMYTTKNENNLLVSLGHKISKTISSFLHSPFLKARDVQIAVAATEGPGDLKLEYYYGTDRSTMLDKLSALWSMPPTINDEDFNTFASQLEQLAAEHQGAITKISLKVHESDKLPEFSRCYQQSWGSWFKEGFKSLKSLISVSGEKSSLDEKAEATTEEKAKNRNGL